MKTLILKTWNWLHCKRTCSWCKKRLGGNPLSFNVTHGICPVCLDELVVLPKVVHTAIIRKPWSPPTIGGSQTLAVGRQAWRA